MRKTIHHLLSFMLMLAVLVSTTSWFSLPVFAADSDTELDTYVSYDTVKPYIDQSSTRETVQIGNDLATYYRGNGFVVVSEANGYALITINDNTGEIRLNGIPVCTVESSENNISPSSVNAYWSLFSDKNYDFSIGGITAAVAAGIIASAIPTLGVSVLVSIVGAYVIQGIIPTGTTARVHVVKYFHIVDTMTGAVEWKTDHTIYINGNYVWSGTSYQ